MDLMTEAQRYCAMEGLLHLGVRSAVASDLPIIEELVAEYLLERHVSGSDVISNLRSLNFNMSVVRSILDDTMDGAISLYGEDGIDMAVDAMLPWDSTLGKVACSSFTYVRPAIRRLHVASQLRVATEIELRKMGYTAILSGIDLDNKAGIDSALRIGAEPYQVQFVKRLALREN